MIALAFIFIQISIWGRNWKGLKWELLNLNYVIQMLNFKHMPKCIFGIVLYGSLSEADSNLL